MSALLLPTAEAPRLLTDKQPKPASVFAQPRDFLQNRFVYLTLSPRARGLSIGVNLNPDRECNFDCVYCEVDRSHPADETEIDCDVAADELEQVLRLVNEGGLRRLSAYAGLPEELLKLRHVALSGDGEPTISPKFLEAVEMVVHVRARSFFPFFKIVLITNASGLDRPEVQAGLDLFTPRDEIWAKLDGGSQRQMEAINRAAVPLATILENILLTARKRPVIIQSLFCQIGGVVPTVAEIEEFAVCLRSQKSAGGTFRWCKFIPRLGPRLTRTLGTFLSNFFRKLRRRSGALPV
jgi:wyosine [tRNA(Phe)-imidazoG37] synthetase (radical SAM superfamily)